MLRDCKSHFACARSCTRVQPGMESAVVTAKRAANRIKGDCIMTARLIRSALSECQQEAKAANI